MPLQKDFRGLPDYVGNYSGGRQPFELSPEIQQVIEAGDFIEPGEFLFQTATLTGVGQIAQIPAVPQNEQWRVTYLGMRFNDPVASLQWVPVWSDDGSRFFGLEFYPNYSWPAGQLNFIGKQFSQNQGFIMRPNNTIGWHLRTASVGPNVPVTVVCFRQRIRF